MDSVAVLDQDIKRATINKEVVVAVFIDIEKAYDSMWREGLLIKLYNAGVSGRMFSWIKDFLSNRVIQVRIEGELSEVASIMNGTPQGSVISPVLFNIMINDIFKNINSGFGRSLFADDGTIWRRGRNIDFLMKQTQEALGQVGQWATKWGFKISTSKSKYMIFGLKRKSPGFTLNMYDCPLERVKVFKFLGVWMEERLNWNTHIEKTTVKCEKMNNLLRCLGGSDWGAERSTMLMIYRAMIRSSLDYGSFVFGAAAKTVLQKLDKVQTKALRICSGAFRSTPIPALLIEMGETPLHIRRQKLGLQYWARLTGLKHDSTAKGLLTEYWEFGKIKKKSNFLCNIKAMAKKEGLDNVIGTVWSPVPFWKMPEPDVQLDFLGMNKSHVSRQINEFISTNSDGMVHIFTDGSKDPVSGRAGFGVHILNHEQSYSTRVSDRLSVFSTELLAIWRAMVWIQENKPNMCYIYSDSSAALQALRGTHSKGARPDLVLEILSYLCHIEAAGSRVIFVWIPGHCGILGNESADAAAKQSLLKNVVDIKIPLGKLECISIFKNLTDQMWQRDWENEPRGRHYFSCQPLVKNNRLLLGSSRKDQVVITRLRLGHCGLAAYLKIVGKHPNGLCQCGQMETVRHILLSCQGYARERKILFSELSDLGLTVFSIKSIFAECRASRFIDKAVIKFLISTALYSRI